MRVVHFERAKSQDLVQPLCGEWGSMDTDWSRDPDAVTCPACRDGFDRARRDGADGLTRSSTSST